MFASNVKCSEVHLNICSRRIKQTTILRHDIGRIKVSYVYTEDSKLLVGFLSRYIEGLDMVPVTGSSLSLCCRYTVDSCLQDVQTSDHRGHVDLQTHNLKDRINQGLSNLLAEMLLLSVDILTFIRVPTEIQKHNSKIFP